ncbi:hypothetical protein [Thalassospira marina]|uniref:Uncharacterized protein n=1 Tax=Thalassospira marina TaxID=2048283 RepID=A0A2N3KXW6_9PROT|nr:hypothetical protein [Thalassospira marina]PKR55402.1 hypothetical protein COO20_04325 [Thalassospira marina]
MDFDRIWALVEPAVDRADEGVTKQEIADGIQSGAIFVFTRTNPDAAALCFAVRGRLRIGVAGGDLGQLKIINDEITHFARVSGFRGTEIIGRDGWERALPNFRKSAVILRQDF